MSPAASAVLWNMLVEAMGQVGMTVDIPPVEALWKLVLGNVGVRQGRMELFLDLMTLQDLVFVVALWSQVVGRNGREGCDKEGQGMERTKHHDQNCWQDRCWMHFRSLWKGSGIWVDTRQFSLAFQVARVRGERWKTKDKECRVRGIRDPGSNQERSNESI